MTEPHRRAGLALRLICAGLVCVCGCGSPGAPPDPTPSAEPEQADSLAGALADWQGAWKRQAKVAVGNFVHAERGSGSAFGRYLQQEVSRLLAAGGTRPVDRRLLEAQLASARTSLEHYVGATRGVGGVRKLEDGPEVNVWGDYRILDDAVEVTLCTSSPDSEVETKTVSLPLEEARRHGALRPPNHEAAKSSQLALADERQEFQLELWVDRGVGGTYELGDTLSIFVRPERDCFVKIVHVASDGSMQVVFPNTFDANNRLTASSVHVIGGPDYAFQLTVSEPSGEEALFAYASTRQFADIAELLQAARRTGVVKLGRADAAGIRTFRSRGLTISPRQPEQTEGGQAAEPLRACASTRYVVLAPQPD